jgi:hypothetical protein
VTTPSHIVAFTVADIDYAALHELWVFDRATGTETARSAPACSAAARSSPDAG